MTAAESRRDIVISAPVLTTVGSVCRVEADVDGTPTWFESSDAALAPRAEAFASAFLGPAFAVGRRLQVDAPLDTVWQQNVAKILPVWQRWWGYDLADPIFCTDIATGTERNDDAAEVPTKSFTASCFTGGADSFHTLLRSPRAAEIDRLLFVHGYDIPLADETRMAAWEPGLRRVAAATGKPAIVIRTNLRLHPLFRASNWERTHGGALAAAGHVLADGGKLLIPSTYTYGHEQPWGSHHLTDPFWSSARFQIIHDDATLNRREKLRVLADEPLTWDTLRVCWEGRTATGNCGMCEKCVRTMTTIHQCGRLDKFTVFDKSVPLADRIAGLKRLPPHLVYVYEGLMNEGLRGDTRRAVRKLLAASRPPGLVRRAVRKAMRGFARLMSASR